MQIFWLNKGAIQNHVKLVIFIAIINCCIRLAKADLITFFNAFKVVTVSIA